MVLAFEAGGGRIVRLSCRPGSTTVSMDATYLFDGEGRLLTAAMQGRILKRGFDNRIIEKRRIGVRRGEFGYRTLSSGEAEGAIGHAHEQARNMLEVVAADADSHPRSVRLAAESRLERIAAWSIDTYAIDRRRFLEAYVPVGILPPDQYMSVVLQATEGCHFNQCSFCTFYRDRPFHVKRPASFERHVARVKTFLGRGLPLRKSIFLADANALVQPQAWLRGHLDVVGEHFEIMPIEIPLNGAAAWRRDHPEGMDGVYSFLDTFTGYRKSASDFAELRERGLRRVYVGVESGHGPLLAFMGKPGSPEEVESVVRAAKASGVNVAVIILLGAGGAAYADGHVADTTAMLSRLPLGAGDLVFFSPLSVAEGSEYAARARDEAIREMDFGEMIAQEEAIRLVVSLDPRVKLARYRVEEFIY